MPIYLLAADHPDQPVLVDKPVLLIGRQAECDVILTCSRKVSRRHCCLVQISDWFVVRDLGSTNGVAVNGRAVASEARLQLGDELTIGDVAFELMQGPVDATKGKVCIGPPLKSTKPREQRRSDDRRVEGEAARAFRGIPSSRPRRDGTRVTESGERRSKSINDDALRAKARQERRDKRPMPSRPDDFGSDTFGSDTFGSDLQEEMIDQTFGSDVGDVVGGQPAEVFAPRSRDEAPGQDFADEPDDHDESANVDFSFLDDDSDDETLPLNEDDKAADDQRSEQAPRGQWRGRTRASRSGKPPVQDGADDGGFDDDGDIDFEYDDDEPRERPSRPKKKRRPRDASLNQDEKINEDDARVRRSTDESGGMESIIELDEFDLLD